MPEIREVVARFPFKENADWCKGEPVGVTSDVTSGRKLTLYHMMAQSLIAGHEVNLIIASGGVRPTELELMYSLVWCLYPGTQQEVTYFSNELRPYFNRINTYNSVLELAYHIKDKPSVADNIVFFSSGREEFESAQLLSISQLYSLREKCGITFAYTLNNSFYNMVRNVPEVLTVKGHLFNVRLTFDKVLVSEAHPSQKQREYELLK